MFGATVWGGVWGIPGVLEENIKKTSISKEDMRRLQVIQNKVMKIQTNMKYGTPTNILLKKTNSLSVHQLIAHYSMTQVYKVMKSQQPHYHYKRLVEVENDGPGTRSAKEKRVEFNFFLS